QIAGDLRKVMKLNRHHSLFREGRIDESLAEHRALMAALERRDFDTARTLSKDHFRNGPAAVTRLRTRHHPPCPRRAAAVDDVAARHSIGAVNRPFADPTRSERGSRTRRAELRATGARPPRGTDQSILMPRSRNSLPQRSYSSLM
ncbi:MAG TPA: FCD domain-containing protein, partial [Burkholderiaceae bacterium]|nr:FCD domain-containing protein [Burkholderiaceae bacterium]